ncbi:MAG: FdtA/QdtA family cupin domain-containing protein [Pseudomonadota bacterium]
MSLMKWIEFPSLGDDRGGLVALEAGAGYPVPFDVRRVYYIHSTEPGISRGFHAHRQLQQVAICVSGRCRVVLDDGTTREEGWLDAPTKGLFIGDLTWRELHDFSPGCVVLVLASEHHDEADYIRDYDEFLEHVQHG